MKLLFAFLLTLSPQPADTGFYTFSITTLEGQTHTLQEYQGRKILMVVLPVSQSAEDSAFLKRIDSVASVHSTTLTVIGIPSYEDGYEDSAATALQTFYRSVLDTSVIITQGMYTHQSSDSMQHPLFNWLTHATGNTYFEQEVEGVCEMYYINENGTLSGVIGPEAKFSNTVINKMFE